MNDKDFAVIELDRVDVEIDGAPVLRDISWRLRRDEHWGVVGANGSGKSTLLALVAGTRWPAPGRGRRTYDFGNGPERDAVEARRHITLVGHELQDRYTRLGWNFAAVDVVLSGVFRTDVPRLAAAPEDLERARALLDEAHLLHLADRPFLELSRGEQRRVLIARALAFEPRLLLLDEPMAALDAATRLTVRADLAHHLQDYDGAAVLVTHDPLDAMSLADRIVVLEDGRVVQEGAPVDVARAPRTEYVARLVGLNLLRGEGRGGVVELDEGGVVHLAEPAQGPVLVAFPPSAVVLHRHRPEGSARNTWHGRVTALEQHAHTVRAQVAIDDGPSVLADVTAAAVAELGLGLGVPVWVSFKATETHAYPA